MPTTVLEDARAVITSHEQYARAGDLDGVMTNIAEDVVLLAGGTPLVEGTEAFREYYAGLFRMGCWDFDHDYRGGEIVGDTVFLHGVAEGTLTSEEGVVTKLANNFIHVLRLGNDGRLRVWRAAFAPASP